MISLLCFETVQHAIRAYVIDLFCREELVVENQRGKCTINRCLQFPLLRLAYSASAPAPLTHPTTTNHLPFSRLADDIMCNNGKGFLGHAICSRESTNTEVSLPYYSAICFSACQESPVCYAATTTSGSPFNGLDVDEVT